MTDLLNTADLPAGESVNVELPEPVGQWYEYRDAFDRTRTVVSYSMVPSATPIKVLDLYTADQVRQAVLAERQRNREACLDVSKDAEAAASLGDVRRYDRASYIAGYQDAAVDCDEAIRQQGGEDEAT